MRIEGTLNKAQTERLFEENAVFFGFTEGVSETVVADLFGLDVLDFVNRSEEFKSNVVGDYLAVTKVGFNIAVVYHNAKLLAKNTPICAPRRKKGAKPCLKILPAKN